MPVQITLTPASLAEARHLAEERLTNPARHGSPHRPSARNPLAQLRGAAGELAVTQWAEDNGWRVVRGYQDDEDRPDIVVAGISFEIMTARIDDREVTGFCVPPDKLRTARRRGVWGYLFVGTDASSVPSALVLQGACALAHVDADAARPTCVRKSRRVLNHVVRSEHLVGMDEVAAILRGRQ